MFLLTVTSRSAAAFKILDPDSSLVKELQENSDMTAFIKIMNKYKSTVYNFCLKYTGNRENAEEISQDVFMKVYRNINSFRGDSKFSTWLYKITLNTCKNSERWYRKRLIRGNVSIIENDGDEENKSPVIPDRSYDPERIFLNKELGTIIHSAAGKLPVKQKAVVIMRDFLGKTYEEIASILNINIGTVKSSLARGRLNIAKQIGEYYQK